MSTRHSIYYSDKPEEVHIYFDYADDMVHIDTVAWNFSLTPCRFVAWVKAMSHIAALDIDSLFSTETLEEDP